MATSTAKKPAAKKAATKPAAKPVAKPATKAKAPKAAAVAKEVQGTAAALTDKTNKTAATLLGDADKAATVKPVDGETLGKLIESQKTASERMASIRGVAANEIKQAEKEKGLHRGAFKQILALEKMTVENRNAFLASFDSMRLERGYATQGNLFGDVEPEPKTEAKDERKPSGKLAAAGK